MGELALGFASVVSAEVQNFGTSNDLLTGRAVVSSGRGEIAVHIKDLPHRELLNEVIVYLLARAAKLPVPESYIGLADSQDFPVKKGPLLEGTKRLVFVSRSANSRDLGYYFQNTERLPESIRKNLISWSKLGAAVAFDTWVGNIDRNLGNILYAGKDQFILIDHGQAFGGRSYWENRVLEPSIKLQCKLSLILRLHNLKMQELTRIQLDAKSAETVMEEIDFNAVRAISLQLPGVSEDILCQMGSFLAQRLQHVLSLMNHNLDAERLTD